VSYKIVRNSNDEVVAFGYDDDNYVPTIKEGETLTIESDKVAAEIIKKYKEKRLVEHQEIATQKAALLERLGITADEAKLLLA
jgi:hypothetical protein